MFETIAVLEAVIVLWAVSAQEAVLEACGALCSVTVRWRPW